MNANELAQYLEEQMSGWVTDLVLGEAANMLRQQQVEIETLTKFLDETCQIGKFIVWNSTDKAQEK